jgi:hypothetical protein
MRSPEFAEVKEAYVTWFASLTPGVEVYYRGRNRSDHNPHVTKVKKITPKGMVRTEDGELFTAGGRQLGGPYYAYLYPFTDAHYQWKARRAMLKEIERIDWSTVDDEGLRKIAELTVAHLLPEYAKKDAQE